MNLVFISWIIINNKKITICNKKCQAVQVLFLNPLKWSPLAKNRMLFIPSVQVGPALPLVATATASCSNFFHLCTALSSPG